MDRWIPSSDGSPNAACSARCAGTSAGRRCVPTSASTRSSERSVPRSLAACRTHRGRQPLTLSDAELRSVVDGMVAAGALLRTGHRVQLPDGRPSLDPVMRERVDRLLATLTAGGASPPPADGVATRLGIPPGLVDQLRRAGELVSVAPRIDYPREAWLEIARGVDDLAAGGTAVGPPGAGRAADHPASRRGDPATLEPIAYDPLSEEVACDPCAAPSGLAMAQPAVGSPAGGLQQQRRQRRTRLLRRTLARQTRCRISGR